MDAFSTLLDGRELTLFGVVFWLQKYYTKIPPEGMRLRSRPMCWFLHCIDNSVSSSNIIDGGSQFIGKQWEHHTKPMGARPWLLESRTHTMDQLCVYYVICLQLLFPPAYGAVKFIDFGFPFYYHCNDVCWHCRHECISLTTMNGRFVL